ncbi:EF-P 5-aminopentanol modification-associated protein YfmH [Apilactobacillus micheneri]|uniref:EF-P 5-aminopentanol modification-associated protein YfmH n=1 Tax=Apilactobacillus micheneri TaxID=1899430 RepID=UPI000D0325A8|nr:pitrilysin family protein [Apilactobacillus micheneri]TPR35172.1 insulinase family protein [Apilactobacillus micheneri]
MIELKYPQYNETVYKEQLENGLTVVIEPKKGFQKTYASLTIKYGSIDNTFISYDNEKKEMPAGIAHFLEHKMFDKDGYDAMDVFSKYGASSNAFTSFNRTSYLFSCTNYVNENLNTLLDFVQIPYFNEKKVNKEKEIIAQEIKMYNNDPNAALYFNTIQNMYPDSHLNVDIAGTVESINKITADDLYTAHKTFYQPANMQLNIVGNVDPDEVIKIIKENQDNKTFLPAKDIERIQVPSKKINNSNRRQMDVFNPKVAVGIKGDSALGKNIKYELSISLLLEILFSEDSDNYAYLYNHGIIDDSFGFDFDCNRNFNFSIIAGDTEYPKEFINNIKDILMNAINNLDNYTDDLELIKREEIGQHILIMNSIEATANNLGDSDNNFINLYDEIRLINDITINDLKEYGAKLLLGDNIISNIIIPYSNK